FRWQRKKLQIRGAQILSDDSYLAYFEETKDVAQQRIWTFYEAILFRNIKSTEGSHEQRQSSPF
ncbi:MAG: hypothetical protein J7K96_01940, partial [Desulfobacteraceae bacterium]|nr:hypothetical protein [Desulfobacteraceae bacterium]